MTMPSNDNATPHGAGEYDEKVHKVVPFYETFHAETTALIRAAKPSPGLWLDTGCGTGFLVEKALGEFPETKFLLADPSEAMLEEAKARLGAFIPDRVEILAPAPTGGLVGALNGPVDVITAIQSHHYLDREGRRAATWACFEMLAPGGLYVTFENVRPLTQRGVEVALSRMRAFQVSRGLSAEFAEGHAGRFDTAYFPLTVEEHLALLRETGFSTVELLWYSVMQAGFYAVK
jgi:tRNA (cmo5U34)-methyltransferase